VLASDLREVVERVDRTCVRGPRDSHHRNWDRCGACSLKTLRGRPAELAKAGSRHRRRRRAAAASRLSVASARLPGGPRITPDG
jgi:hypothetical protein